jgi:protein SCO1
MLLALALALALALHPAALVAAPASSLSDQTLAAIKFDQNLNSQVSLELRFRDEAGRSVQLGDCFGGKPVILVLGYYECPMLCTLVLNGLVDSLLDLKANIGNQFTVVNVSINPAEKPELAAAKKRTYLRRYGRPGAEPGWHFLTGDEAAIKKLADEVGFHYAYDPAANQYAHPSGIIVLTPQGKIARYFFGVNFPAKELSVALREASDERVGSPIQQLILLCFHYSPLRGKYGKLILLVLRVGGLLTVLGLAGLILTARQRHRTLATPTPSVPTPKVAGGTTNPGLEVGL